MAVFLSFLRECKTWKSNAPTSSSSVTSTTSLPPRPRKASSTGGPTGASASCALPNCQADTGLADMSIEDAVAKGARTMVVGVVNAGGVLPDHWIAEIVKAIEAGMNVATGLHKRLSSIPEIAEAAAKHGAKLHDVRFSDTAFATGKGTRRYRQARARRRHRLLGRQEVYGARAG
jgi:hypothetical protein